jgi:hypothetical protein
MEKKMIDAINFCIKIERFANEKNLQIADAIIHYCSENDMEIETAANLISKNKKLMQVLEIEAKQNRQLKDNTLHATLPIPI